MSGALLGFKIGGEKKLLRLHGERTCEGVLTELLNWLRSVSDARLHAYARTLKPVDTALGPFPTPDDRAVLLAFFEDHFGESCQPVTWAEAFASFPELEGWHAGFPYMPAAQVDACGDVSWGFLLDLDARGTTGELQIYINRHGRFPWRELNGAHAVCTLSLAHARKLTDPDLSVLQGLLHQNFYSDGIDPLLPLRRDWHGGVSALFPAPGSGDWRAQLHLSEGLSGGRARLLLKREGLHATVRQVSELRLDDPHCAPLLHQALAPDVLALALAIHGPSASLGQLARVAAQKDDLPFTPDAGGLPLLALGLNPNAGLKLPLGPAFFDTLRACLLESGLSMQGWRFLIKQDNGVLRFLLQFFPPSARILRGFAHFINLLASALQNEPLNLARCQPALRGVERILDRTRGRPGAMREENARIFLRAVLRARLAPDEEANLAHESQDVSDFVYEHPAVLKGATWRSLRRRSDDWHRTLLIQVDPAKDVRWPALLPRLATGAYMAVELDCGYLLAEDGLEQRHCIGSYANACASGSTRVFSLRAKDEKGRRIATLELQCGHDGAWHMVQIRGKANTPIQDASVLAAAEQVASAYATAARTYAHALQTHADWDEGSEAIRMGATPGDYSPQPYVIHRQEHWTG